MTSVRDALQELVRHEYNRFIPISAWETAKAAMSKQEAATPAPQEPKPISLFDPRHPYNRETAAPQEPVPSNIRLRACLSFFMSVIKSGESWTETCEAMYAQAVADTPLETAAPQEPAEGFKLLKDSTFQDRSWPDKSDDGGLYHCTCCHCLRNFEGHKRRVTCRVCAAMALDVTKRDPKGKE
jgi:hypothetical protein